MLSSEASAAYLFVTAGRDEEFYKLKAGDQIDILVSNEDKTKIIKG